MNLNTYMAHIWAIKNDLIYFLNSNLRRLVTDDDSKIVNGATAEAHSWPWIGMF